MRFLSIIALSLFLVGCTASKAVYIQGGDKANVTIEASMTGGRVTLNGPFKYCSEPAVITDNGKFAPDSICASLLVDEETVVE